MTEEKTNKMLETMGLIRSELLDLELYIMGDHDALKRFAELGYIKSINNLMDRLDREIIS